ncbi:MULTISPECIES: phage tail protein [unclassified Pantoea]|uniref:phage tail protein n=1 Tax=unclassified Pantoea TaxID=2630326 RepID=UPI001CD7CB0A|nr:MULTISPECIES: phage tail protein [unclassified Pantoea]MCA1179792.1 phage tail protein [Pantoea sp. alder69]MCA1253606.1 phage tail protein [Pantoea sp. alder70]MCA1268278.1 phage tail protein [Pantoea sp. alder81]
MPIYSAGDLNTSALTAPDLYVQVVPPRTRLINGVPTDGLGLVGVGSWGPVNSVFRINSDTDMAFFLGHPEDRKFDLSTAVAISLQLGASNLNCIRVTNGTDKTACGKLSKKGGKQALMLTALYSGTRGNQIVAGISIGTAVNSKKLTISLPGMRAEVFDNIQGKEAALWEAMAHAVNHGQMNIRGPSQLVRASVGTITTAPVSGTDNQDTDNNSEENKTADVIEPVQLTGGTDGIEAATSSDKKNQSEAVSEKTLLGADGTDTLRTGMFALRGSGSQVINLIDVTNSDCWPAMAAFARSEGAYAISQGPASTDCKALSEALNTSGVDDWHFKLLVGDWPFWKDTHNGTNRMIAPATFEAANIASRSPHISTLNKRIPGIIATERQLMGRTYSVPEIGAINSARLDVITNPCPGGHYFGMRSGRNTSSNPTQNDDTYTRMTNFLSLTLAAGFGGVVGDNQTTDLRRETKSTLESFLSNLETMKMIGDPNGGPAFSVRLDATNNPDSRVALGYMTADVQVKYLNVVRYFLVNLEGGGSVSISVSNDSPR